MAAVVVADREAAGDILLGATEAPGDVRLRRYARMSLRRSNCFLHYRESAKQ